MSRDAAYAVAEQGGAVRDLAAAQGPWTEREQSQMAALNTPPALHDSGPRPSAAAMEAAGRIVLDARRVRDSLPVEEAARQALRTGGPSFDELVSKIRAQRANWATDSVA